MAIIFINRIAHDYPAISQLCAAQKRHLKGELSS
jgi:hypothetical protein